MIFENPPDDILRTADTIGMFDRNVPSWHLLVVRPATVDRNDDLLARDYTVVDIPVDSGDSAAIRYWEKRITKARRTPRKAR
jgi:hypothetical protein